MVQAGERMGNALRLPPFFAAATLRPSRGRDRCARRRPAIPSSLFRGFRSRGPQPWREELDLALQMADDLLHARPFHLASPHLEIAADLRQPAGAELGAAPLEG